MPLVTGVRCGRCGGEVGPSPEACWWCLADLCTECWEAHGHCGHAEADAANEAARMLDADGRRRLVMTLVHGRN